MAVTIEAEELVADHLQIEGRADQTDLLAVIG
jgi:hypothetical protein